MQCREIEILVMKYLDGNISELEMEKILKHNEKCEKCAMEFELLSDAIYTIEELPDLEPSEGFTLKVMESIKSQRPYSLSPQIVLLWIMGLAGLGVFMINIFSNVVIPAAKSSGMFLMIYNTLVYAATQLGTMVTEAFIQLTLILGKAVVFAEVMFRDNLSLVLVCSAIFIMTNVLLTRAIRLQQK